MIRLQSTVPGGVKYLTNKLTQVTKIYYFSDRAPQQFKNKKAFANLCYRCDFDVYAEWYFLPLLTARDRVMD